MLQNVVSPLPRLLMGADRSFVYLVTSPGEDVEGEGEIGVRREIQLSHLTPVGTAEEPSYTFIYPFSSSFPSLPHTHTLSSLLSSSIAIVTSSPEAVCLSSHGPLENQKIYQLSRPQHVCPSLSSLSSSPLSTVSHI